VDEHLLATYRDKTTEALLKVVLIDPAGFTAEARQAAEAVLAERGVSLAAERKRIDDEARAARAAADAAREEAGRARQELIEALGEAGRRDGACPACRGADACREVRVAARRQIGVSFHGNATVHQYDVLPVPVSVCEACAQDLQKKSFMSFGPAWLQLVLFFALLLWAVPGMYLGSALGLPVWLVIAFGTGPFGLYLLLSGADWLRLQLAADRLFKLHPLSTQLRRMGYAPVDESSRGTNALEYWSSVLHDPFSSVRAKAEQTLIELGGSEVIARARALLKVRSARRPALRILGALRARDAVEDIRELARTAGGATRDLAREVLENLGEPLP